MQPEISAEKRARYRTREQPSDPATWKPPRQRAGVPTGGVSLPEDGLFRSFMDGNARYLLESFSVDELLYPFRKRAGQPDPPREREIDKVFPFWCADLLGSETGRFLMGAANTLKWIDHPELRRRLEAIVDGVGECQADDGYVYAFPPEGFLHSEQGNYARCWFTQGMIDAGAIVPKALEVMRRGQDWFNRCEYLPELIYLSLGLQGHTASTQMYLSPAGKPEDLQVAETAYVQDWWMDRLLQRDPAAIWRYPLDRPHCYEITGFEAYLDHYLATGDRRFLDSMLATWEMLHENWEHIGGAWAICEGKPYPPQSYRLPCTGELCGSVFWIKFCQRFHRLFPDEEKYTAEIEKSLYNVAFANLAEDGIRYHALLDVAKENPNACNTCCEVHGTRIYSALPEHIYSIAEDGVYVNLFERSVLDLADANSGLPPCRLEQETGFPFAPDVVLTVRTEAPAAFVLRVRVPRWAAREMPIEVNGQPVATGRAGSIVPLEREWRDGDTVSFVLPAELRMTRYPGEDVPHWGMRWALEYGPVLMAVVGGLRPIGDGSRTVILDMKPEDLIGRLRPVPDRPLHYRIENCAGYEVMPYWQVGFETFSAVPVFRPPRR